jgi:hypothetical protein
MRAICAALLALLLAVRLLAPAGFMPAFEHGSVTIVACPDAGPVAEPAPAMHHHHGDPKHEHQPCPYAAASSLGAVGGDFAAIVDVLIVAAALLLGRSFIFLERANSRERPPTRAPPIPA